MGAKTFRDLVVWQKGVQLAKSIYVLTMSMPNEERFGLTSQMRRSAVAIPSNIAEGNARTSTKDYLRFLAIARGSLAELETQLLIATELKFLEPSAEEAALLEEVDRLLQGLIRSLQRKQSKNN